VAEPDVHDGVGVGLAQFVDRRGLVGLHLRRVVVGLRLRRIVVEEPDSQGCHLAPATNLVVCHTRNLQYECCYHRSMARRGGTDDERRTRGEATRRNLVDAGRALFAEKGFFDTSIGDLVGRSGVGTRGAFYHHFKDKAELFRAVFEEVERDLTLRSMANPPPGVDPWAVLTRGLHGFLDSALEPEVQRIMLLDGPVVLGWQALRTIEGGNSIALINEMVREAIANGVIVDQPVGELAHMLVAALEEGSRLVAHADDPAEAREHATKVLDRLLLAFAAEPRKPVRR
jgi:AcrR family transcriptional regulator